MCPPPVLILLMLVAAAEIQINLKWTLDFDFRTWKVPTIRKTELHRRYMNTSGCTTDCTTGCMARLVVFLKFVCIYLFYPRSVAYDPERWQKLDRPQNSTKLYSTLFIHAFIILIFKTFRLARCTNHIYFVIVLINLSNDKNWHLTNPSRPPPY